MYNIMCTKYMYMYMYVYTKHEDVDVDVDVLVSRPTSKGAVQVREAGRGRCESSSLSGDNLSRETGRKL